jgi:MFS family permease
MPGGYGPVLGLPGVRSLLLLGLFARIPATAIPIALTLYTVNALGRGYAAAGLVTTVYTIGAAIGSPALGRLIDRRGLRIALALTTIAQAVVWLVTPAVGYLALLAVAGVGGLLTTPVYTVIRQSLATLVPEERRRPAYALDSIAIEIAFMTGPPLAVIAIITIPPWLAMYLLGAALVAAGAGVFALNPPTRPANEDQPAGDTAPGLRGWLRAPVIAVLVAVVAMTLVLSATELAIVATQRQAGATAWTGLVIGLWCAYSLIGGLIFGTLRRPVSPLFLVVALSLSTIVVTMAPSWIWLCVLLVPAGMLCAPALTASNETLSRLVPSASTGVAMGLLASSVTAGTALGAPFAGLVADHVGPRWAFLAAGVVGALATLAVMPAYRKATGSPSPGELDREVSVTTGLQGPADQQADKEEPLPVVRQAGR